MEDDASAPRHVAADLVAEARKRGHAINKRLVADWVSIGLLDRGIERGRGRGKGKDYRWSDNQLQLLLTLLDKRATVRRPTLLNIPISLWLIWGDAHVPLRQARRAIATWAGASSSVGATKAHAAARRVVAGLDHPTSNRSARRELRELVEEAARGAQIDYTKLSAVARAVYDPGGSRPAPLPTAMTPETYTRVLQARVTAVQRLERDRAGIELIPEEAFLSARQMYLTTGPTARAAAAPLDQFDQLTAPPLISWQETINAACIHLLTVLGFQLTTPTAPAMSDTPDADSAPT